MPKNILIFSDGTGQAGGLRPDENRSNIYKLYRASRCGPDTDIDPREQLSFYERCVTSSRPSTDFLCASRKTARAARPPRCGRFCGAATRRSSTTTEPCTWHVQALRLKPRAHLLFLGRETTGMHHAFEDDPFRCAEPAELILADQVPRWPSTSEDTFPPAPRFRERARAVAQFVNEWPPATCGSARTEPPR